MGKFSAEYGNIHFLFADNDEYYTESLVKLNLQQYINYCLQREGFTGIYFVQNATDEKVRYVVEMGNGQSKDAYYKAKSESSFLFLGKKSVLEASEEVKINEKIIGTKYYARHLTEESLVNRIHYMMKNRHSKSKYAFVLPLSVFCELYEHEEVRKELQENIQRDNKNTLILLTASMKADESFSILTQNPQIFCSELFPEMKKIFAAEQRFKLYKEIGNELGERYHIFNQLREQEIFRMLQYIRIVDGKEEVEMTERLSDYAFLLYAWYHYPDFGWEREIGLPEKNNHSLEQLGNCLRRENGRIWQQMERWLNDLQKDMQGERSLKELVRNMEPEEKEWHPVFSENSEIRRLRRGIRGIADLHNKMLVVKLHQVEQVLREPCCNYEEMQGKGLNRMLKMLEELQSKQLYSDMIAKYILEYLQYSVGKWEQEDIYKEKCRIYEAIVEYSCMYEELKKINKAYRESQKEYEKEYSLRCEKMEQMQKDDPLYYELAHRGEVSIESMKIDRMKERILNLKKAIDNSKALIDKNEMKIMEYEEGIKTLTLAISELRGEKKTDNYKDIALKLQKQWSEENGIVRELQEADTMMQTVFEETHNLLCEKWTDNEVELV